LNEKTNKIFNWKKYFENLNFVRYYRDDETWARNIQIQNVGYLMTSFRIPYNSINFVIPHSKLCCNFTLINKSSDYASLNE
jgi:hypothetical protein